MGWEGLNLRPNCKEGRGRESYVGQSYGRNWEEG